MAHLYDKYGCLLYSVALRCVGDRAAAEDLVQETFLQAWSRIDSFCPDRERLRSWLLAIVRNRSIDHLRCSRHQATPAPMDRDNGLAQLGWANDAFGLLNPDQHRVLELMYFQGFTQTEIAQRLSQPVGMVTSLVRSALQAIRARVHSGTAV